MNPLDFKTQYEKETVDTITEKEMRILANFDNAFQNNPNINVWQWCEDNDLTYKVAVIVFDFATWLRRQL